MELQIIHQKIHEIRGQKVLFDFDLAEMYEVQTKILNQSVQRNIGRFPPDFMFQLTLEEWKNLKSQIVTSSWGGTRKLPFAFTEQGVAMLSSVLRSEKAIEINVSIMRAFVALRHFVLNYNELSEKVAGLELKYDLKISEIFEVLDLMASNSEVDHENWDNRDRIGFKK